MDLFQIDSLESVLEKKTYIVPINITYYPIRTRENILSNLAANLVEDIPERMVEEIMTEGTMLLSGVDVDMRFGEPIEIKEYLKHSAIKRDISATSRINFNDPIPSIKRMRKEAQNIMQRYMSAIYNMTTVNHDHLFASMLRMIPFKKIKAHDLRRRVFLSVTGKFNKNGVFFHNTMKKNQIHLLTDDCFNRFKNFSSVAIESGFVKEKGEMLVKDTAKISFDFHRIRIDNPVEVIANEVEPLTSLQRRIRRLAREPGFWIRHKIARRLMKKAILEFEEDYKTYYIEGESKKKDIGMPFLIKGSSREMGVVLFHGYMAAPFEVKELANYLGRRGFWVYVPRIKGHGTSPEDLATRKYTDWMESADEGYAVISNLCRRVVAGGFSNGAGLALDLTARIEDVEGVFAVCPPLRLKDFSSKFVPALDFWNKFMDKVHIDSGQKEFVENNPENPHINYLRNPISGLRELERLMDSIESKLSAIQTPTLVIQSYGDPVVDQRGSRKVFELLGSEDKSYILFNFDRHGILLGDGAHRVHKAIADFIDHLR
jgi:esterase/lipase